MYDLTFLHTNYTEKSANYDADGADKYHQAPAFDKEVTDLNKKYPRGKIFLNVDIFPHPHLIFGVGALCGEGT